MNAIFQQGHDPLLLFVLHHGHARGPAPPSRIRSRVAAKQIALVEEIGHTLDPMRVPLREIVGRPEIIADPP